MKPSATETPKPSSLTTIERFRIAPPPGVAELSLPLTFFDIAFASYLPKYRLLFYPFPSCSKSHFLQTIIPNLKTSLSQTLKHFVPVSGNLTFPLETLPEITFQPGDSIAVTISESSADFNNLVGNQPRDSSDFYDYVPTDMNISSLFALQITLFPGAGISIGFTYHHALGDGSSFERFMQAWSLIHSKLLRHEDNGTGNHEELLAANDLLPFYDRSVIKDPSGLANLHWDNLQHEIKKLYQESVPGHHNHQYSNDKVRATYVIRKEDIMRLRDLVVSKRPDLAKAHLSSFVMAISYIWTCLVKSAGQVGELVDGVEDEYFDIPVDMRSRMDSPIPRGYFGNCLGFALTRSTHGELKGDDGFLNAVEVISEIITTKVNVKGGLLSDAGEWVSKYESVMSKRFFSVVGSPKFDFYDVDFGWGKPNKTEVLITDGGGAMSLSRARGSEGGLEVGLSLPREKMDAFAEIFSSMLPRDE